MKISLKGDPMKRKSLSLHKTGRVMTSLFFSAILALTFFATPLTALADAPPSSQEFQNADDFERFMQSQTTGHDSRVHRFQAGECMHDARVARHNEKRSSQPWTIDRPCPAV
jgi:hypothetical protein